MSKILVVDDNPDMIAIIELTLSSAGYEVVSSTHPKEVAQLALENNVDAVILDVMMPEISGYEVLRALREQPQTGGLPILFLSAHADGEERVRGLREGANDFLSKPFVGEELILRVERLIRHNRAAGLNAAGTSLSDLEKSLEARQVIGHLYLGRYRALEVVGEGATGLVFRGWDPRLKRPVALKTLRLEQLLQDDRQQLASKLVEEAVTVARFSHPNIVAVYDVGEGSEIAFIAMEYIDGTSLSDYLDLRGRLEPCQVVPLAIAIARALEAAHLHRVVHHDVKPGNVLLGRDGTIKVTDFGVAKLVTSVVNVEGKLFGTPGYLPPEALLGHPYTEVGDLFGLGVILYQSLTGQSPFEGNNLHEVIVKTVKNPVPNLCETHASVPPALGQLILKLLEKHPEERLQTASEVLNRLLVMPEANQPWDPGLQGRQLDLHTSSHQHSVLLPTSKIDLPLSEI